MAHRKAGGSAKNLRDSNPSYLGVKISDGQSIRTGQIILRQRGTKIIPGKNVSVSKDHTLFAKIDGVVKFSQKNKINFDGKVQRRKFVEIV